MTDLPQSRTWWLELGFQKAPIKHFSNGNLKVYRCWGLRRKDVGSNEWGTGFFSIEKPKSVLEAEMRTNIVNYNNGVHFVSTFIIKPGIAYWQGPVAHGPKDISTPATQIYIDPEPS